MSTAENTILKGEGLISVPPASDESLNPLGVTLAPLQPFYKSSFSSFILAVVMSDYSSHKE